MEINNIYKVSFQNSWDRYYGFLRNEKKFNIGDSVFIGYGNESIFRGIVMGVELTDNENPEAIYKIQIPNGLVYDFDGNENTSLKLNCNRVFNSLEDAKESRIKQSNKLHKLEIENIEKFFNQFEINNLQLNQTKLEDCNISNRLLNCLKAMDLIYLEQLKKVRMSDIKKYRMFGAKSQSELIDFMKDSGLKFLGQ